MPKVVSVCPFNINQVIVHRPDLNGDYLFVPAEHYINGVNAKSALDLFSTENDVKLDLITGASVLDQMGVLFKAENPEEQFLLYEFFDIDPEATAKAGFVHPRVLGSRRQEHEGRFRYPFDELSKIGDGFFVPGGVRTTISVYASNYCKYLAPERMIRCFEVPGGILVMLVFDPNMALPRSVAP